MSLRLRVVAPRQGLFWLRASFGQFVRRPLSYMGLFVMYLLAVLFALSIPVLGSLLVVTSLPLLTLTYLHATRAAVSGGSVLVSAFVEPLRAASRRDRIAFLKLSLAYGALTLVIVALSDVIDAGSFAKVQSAMIGGDDLALSDDERTNLLAGMALRFGLAALVSIPFWHAPALILWHGQGVGLALFSSALACWKARGALAVYAAVWFAVVAGVGISMALLLGVLGLRSFVGAMALPGGLILTAVFYVSLYFIYADSFEVGDEAAAATAIEPPTAT